MGVIDEIKQRIDIVELASEYVADLKKVGHNFRGLCPFHSETVGSFYIFPDRQAWHCFGACGTGGDIFSLVMRKEGVDFGEALRILSEKAGVTLIPKYQNEKEEATGRLKTINEAAAEHFHYLLLNSPHGEQARSYLAKRGISGEMIQDFCLGFSLDSWDALRNELAKRGYREKDLISAGLLVEKDTGGTYDRFRNRLMIPIRDAAGRVTGFGGRALDDSLPKYLNSPQTSVFDKSNTLYGIDRAKDSIRKQDLAVIVEGYTDVIAAHQYGFSNVVASLGTALTGKQVDIIKKLTKRITLALDADVAGEMAMLRGQEVINQSFSQPTSVPGWTHVYENPYHAEWKVVILPQGKDPDDLIKESASEWQRLIENATPVIEYVFQMVVSKLDLAELNDKSSAADQLLPVINKINDPVHQAYYLQKLSRLISVDERTLTLSLKQLQMVKTRGKKKTTSPSAFLPSISSGDPLADYCLSLLFRSPRLHSYTGDIVADFFEHSQSRALFLCWKETPDVDSIRPKLDEVLLEYFDTLLNKTLPPMCEDDEEKALIDCIQRLKMRWLRELKTKEKILISDTQTEVTDSELDELQKSGIFLNNELKDVFLRKKERK